MCVTCFECGGVLAAMTQHTAACLRKPTCTPMPRTVPTVLVRILDCMSSVRLSPKSATLATKQRPQALHMAPGCGPAALPLPTPTPGGGRSSGVASRPGSIPALGAAAEPALRSTEAGLAAAGTLPLPLPALRPPLAVLAALLVLVLLA